MAIPAVLAGFLISYIVNKWVVRAGGAFGAMLLLSIAATFIRFGWPQGLGSVIGYFAGCNIGRLIAAPAIRQFHDIPAAVRSLRDSADAAAADGDAAASRDMDKRADELIRIM